MIVIEIKLKGNNNNYIQLVLTMNKMARFFVNMFDHRDIYNDFCLFSTLQLKLKVCADDENGVFLPTNIIRNPRIAPCLIKMHFTFIYAIC